MDHTPVPRADYTQLLERVDALSAEVDHLRAQLAERDAPVRAATNETDRTEPTTDRRHVIRQAGVAAAGALAAGAALTLAGSDPASAANGDPLTAGAVTVATGTTTLRWNGGPTSAAVFVAKDSTAAVPSPSGGCAIAAGATGDTTVGVFGASSAFLGAGIVASGTGSAVGLDVSGERVPLFIKPLGVPPQSRADFFTAGEIVCDSTAALWLCVQTGTTPAAGWRQIAGPTTAGALNVLAAPARVYDSRPGQPPLGGVKGAFNNTQRVIDAKNNGSGVPGGATAVVVNLAVTATNSGGFGALFKNGTAWPGNASINWSTANTTISNQVLVAVDASSQFLCKIAGTADVIIDVIGYYR